MDVFLRGRTFISFAWNHPFPRSAKELFQNFDHRRLSFLRNIKPRFLSLSSSFSGFSEEGKKKKKERRKGTKKETDTTVFKYNFPRWYGGRGLAQSTIRYSYVRGMHTACPNSAASFCGKIRAFRDRLNNNRIETFQLFSRGYRGPKNLYRIRVPPSRFSFSFFLFFVAPFL